MPLFIRSAKRMWESVEHGEDYGYTKGEFEGRFEGIRSREKWWEITSLQEDRTVEALLQRIYLNPLTLQLPSSPIK